MTTTQTREPGVTTFELPSDTEIEIRRTVAAPRALVFDVHTTPEHLRNWMSGPPGWTWQTCEIDLRPGGAFHYSWAGEGGAELSINGTYRAIDRPGHIVSVEQWSGDWPQTLNTLTFTEQDGLTTITTVVGYPTRDARDLALQSGMKEGMEATFGNLETYLAVAAPLRMRLELVPVPVTDIDRALQFYAGGLGCTVDHDIQPGNGSRIVQLTPQGSACSLLLSKGLPGLDDNPGTLRGLHLVVEDVARTRDALESRGLKPGDVTDLGGILYCELTDPDGNTFMLQEIPPRG